MLDLLYLLNINKNKRNDFVLDINDCIISEDYTFEEEYGALCGGSIEGLLEEESQEMLFELSGISIVEYGEFDYILEQRGNKFRVEKAIGTEGVCVPSEHFNFNKIELMNYNTPLE